MELFTGAGFVVESNEYIKRETENKKEGLSVPRIFIQAKFTKPLQGGASNSDDRLKSAQEDSTVTENCVGDAGTGDKVDVSKSEDLIEEKCMLENQCKKDEKLEINESNDLQNIVDQTNENQNIDGQLQGNVNESRNKSS